MITKKHLKYIFKNQECSKKHETILEGRANRLFFLAFGGERKVEPSGGWFLCGVPQESWSSTTISGKANDWRNRGHVVLNLFSDLKKKKKKI